MGTSNSLVRAASVVGLLVHLDRHGAARGHITLGGDGGGSGIASHVLGGDILNRRVAQRNTRARGVIVRSVNLFVMLVKVPQFTKFEMIIPGQGNRTQSCWKVAWATTFFAARAVASAAEKAYFILTVFVVLGSWKAESRPETSDVVCSKE